MNTPFRVKTIVPFLCMLVLLTACAPAAAPTTAAGTSAPVTPAAATAPIGATATIAATATTGSPATFTDPFAYCAAVGTIDQPDTRYTGPKTPDAVVKGVIKASGAPADAPVDVFSKGTFWRCMDKQVYACFVGANLPCESKANTNKEPTAEMNDFCKANPTADFLPAAVTGHDTIYEWACKDGKATVGKQIAQVDAQGYIREFWYAIAAP